MLRAVQTMGSNILAGSNNVNLRYLIPFSVHMQTIRWKRKPIWLPTAKTKVFRVPPRRPIIEEENSEIKRLNNNYRTYMKSILRHIRQSVAESQVQFDEAVIKKAEEEDFLKCNAINDEWNKMVAQQRDQRLAEEREKRKENVIKKLIAKEKRDLMLKHEIDEHVKCAKKEAPTFITEKNIDQAIREVLANTFDYNSAIDLNGNIYTGKYPPSKEGEVKEGTVSNEMR